MTFRRTAPALLLGASLVFFTAFFLAPLSVVALASATNADGNFDIASYARVLADRYHWNVILVTFRVSLLTTLACVVLGYPLAWYLVRIVKWKAWRRTCVVLLLVPMFTSNIVRSFGWMVLLGRTGLVNDSLMSLGLVDRPMRFLGTELGILIGMVYVLLPFAVLSIGNALATVDQGIEDASADLGASAASTFRHITLPLTLPGVMSGSIIVFTLAVSAYVTPSLLSNGRVTVLSMLIYQQYSSVFDVHYGGALSMVLLALTLAMVGVAARVGEPVGSRPARGEQR